MMPSVTAVQLQFRTIDLAAHAATCVAFCRETFLCSFGNDERFVREQGPNGEIYLEWLRLAVAEHPHGHVHAWREDVIVGQIHMRLLPNTHPPCGYVNQFCLVPELRGTGAGQALHRYAIEGLRREGAQRARLTVSPANLRAAAFYRKHGWKDLGPRTDSPDTHLLELAPIGT